MSQMRAGDLHAGAQSTRRGSATSTSSDDFVGNATDDAGGVAPRISSRHGSCQMIARGAPLQVTADSS
jgi:hypothetical protein